MELLVKLLEQSDIKINGNRPWDIKINNDRVFNRILSDYSLGLGESYMDGDWDCDRLDLFFEKLLSSKIEEKINLIYKVKIIFHSLKAKILNMQSKERAFEVGEQHYDLGNDLFEKMLDPYMQYSCAYWGNGAKNLSEAQEHKLEMICQKLQLKPGDKVLEIGCGWGGLSRYAVEKYGVEWVGLTVSKEQKNDADIIAKKNNLHIEYMLCDYRDMLNKPGKQYDKIVSVGMFEHVGSKK
jgi:cyclopropane-fatty-acyl-phospholipid synthase